MSRELNWPKPKLPRHYNQRPERTRVSDELSESEKDRIRTRPVRSEFYEHSVKSRIHILETRAQIQAFDNMWNAMSPEEREEYDADVEEFLDTIDLTK